MSANFPCLPILVGVVNKQTRVSPAPTNLPAKTSYAFLKKIEIPVNIEWSRLMDLRNEEHDRSAKLLLKMFLSI